jgi:hypothetical protein
MTIPTIPRAQYQPSLGNTGASSLKELKKERRLKAKSRTEIKVGTKPGLGPFMSSQNPYFVNP